MTLVRSRLEVKMEPVIQSEFRSYFSNCHNKAVSYLVRNVKQKEAQTWGLVHPDSESVVHVTNKIK